LALLRGDVPAAEKCLFLSGQIQPSGTTFWGPRMTLALELLRRHRQDAVLNFLDECSRSWPKECPNCSFEKWAATIRRGKIPDFGATLIYSSYPDFYALYR
jgi:hypothetical protein